MSFIIRSEHEKRSRHLENARKAKEQFLKKLSTFILFSLIKILTASKLTAGKLFASTMNDRR